ncbi:MAG: hypothetical protein KGZ32_01850, partial [Dethiobacter sp.]|nr:hypothetical protein [Dethiobacter sp.]
MVRLSQKARSLWAKKSQDGGLFWLPLTMHMMDSAAVAQKLWNHWLPEGVRQVISAGTGGDECAGRLFVF